MSLQHSAPGWSGLVDALDDEAPTIDTPAPAHLSLPTPSPEPQMFRLVAPPVAPPPAPQPKVGWRTWAGLAVGVLAFALSVMLVGGDSASQTDARATPNPRGLGPIAPAVAAPPAKASLAAPPQVSPVLAVLSTPAGAQVEIAGRIYGKTPLIMPSPDRTSLMITLRYPEHSVWTEIVRPNEAGHFQVEVDLKPGFGMATDPFQPQDQRPRRARRR